MSKYCPICLGEYRDAITVCPRHNAELSNVMPKAFERLVDLYAASDAMECEHLISLLDAEEIFARESVSNISQLPTVGDTRFIIAVLQEDLLRAKRFIEQARRDNVISQNGSFC